MCIPMESFWEPFFFAQKISVGMVEFRRNRVLGPDKKNDNYVFLSLQYVHSSNTPTDLSNMFIFSSYRNPHSGKKKITTELSF